jgi:monoamine oxidase
MSGSAAPPFVARSRRRWLQGAAYGAGAAVLAAPGLWLAGCRSGADEARYDGGWVGQDAARGHRLRDGSLPRDSSAALQRRAAVLVVGGGIAGMACARALRQRGIDDVHLLEHEDEPGGNSRAHTMGGMACPLGAHYLPLPDDRAPELAELLAEFGLWQRVDGQPRWDERHLCHSPQERLYLPGMPPPDDEAAAAPVWHHGLLPPLEALPAAEQAATQAQYRRFAGLVDRERQARRFAVPTARAAWSPALASLDSLSFSSWLDQQGLDAPALRWYLDYCCRDDYGAQAERVSAWAGLHYFASRQGFQAPGDGADEDLEPVLTWPEGNAWLVRRLAAPLGDHLHTARSVHRVEPGRHSVTVDAWDHRAGRAERWTARQVVLATPLFVALRLLASPSAALREVVARQGHAPWLVANLQLDAALVDRPGAAPAWDNVLYRSPALGYVDAMHQSTRPHGGATVLTSYWALGGANRAAAAKARRSLLDEPWSTWAERVVLDLQAAHPDLRRKLRRVDLAAYGHAMSVPEPGLRSSAALAALARPEGRVHLAHADLSGYSVFEEAFFHGHRVGRGLVV